MSLEKAFEHAAERYAELGVDVEGALALCAQTPISMQCWQGDDVRGFENQGPLGGGIAATGNYPGAARTADELRQDLAMALSLLPGKKKVNLHAIYAEPQTKAARNALTPDHFSRWIDWAKELGIGLDFNPTFFSHPLADDGFTLSHPDPEVRAYWIDHGRCSRRIGEAFGKALGQRSVINFWMPDGYKDTAFDTFSPRRRMLESLDAIFKDDIDESLVADAVESKLFGLGVESYTVGSNEFFMGYAVSRRKLLCLDTGHFHPTETVSAKISACLLYLPELLLHVSRPVRWDSDHVVSFDDEVRAVMSEVVRGNFLGRVHLALDFFDASINRVAALVIGMRNAQKALLNALLEPTARLREAEEAGDYTARLALLEEYKLLPFGAIWDMYCLRNQVPVREGWLDEIRIYEKEVLSGR